MYIFYVFYIFLIYMKKYLTNLRNWSEGLTFNEIKTKKKILKRKEIRLF